MSLCLCVSVCVCVCLCVCVKSEEKRLSVSEAYLLHTHLLLDEEVLGNLPTPDDIDSIAWRVHVREAFCAHPSKNDIMVTLPWVHGLRL